MQPPKTIPSRIIIYPKDVELITGKKVRTARAMLKDIRKAYGKEQHQLISVQEFCSYIGIDEALVRKLLID
jgi:hypothetical protein